MIVNTDYLITDEQGKELPEKGFQLFNLSVNDGDIRQYAQGYIPSHWHSELEIFVLLKGRIHIGIGEQTYNLQAGDGCFINTEVIHSFTADVPSSCTFRSFVFGSDIVGGTPGSIFDISYVRPLLENGVPFLKFQRQTGDSVYFEQFDKAFAACVKEEYGYEFQVRNALSHILLYVSEKSRSAPRRSIPSLHETRLKEMLTWIHKHLEKNITVSEIAGAVSICPRECQRIFQQYLHYSPIEYVQRKRIFTAAKQLSDTDYPITDIALSCGFSNPSYFSKQFKSLMGTTPGEYRSAVRRHNP